MTDNLRKLQKFHFPCQHSQAEKRVFHPLDIVHSRRNPTAPLWEH